MHRHEIGDDDGNHADHAGAAGTLHGGPAIVVDFGTATTFDVVNAAGAYVGGAISPGVEISLEALGRRGAQLRMVELARPRTVIAKNTVEALQSQLDRMARDQEEMAAHIRSLETNYQNVLSEMVNFQRNMAQQDGLMQNLIQYFLQLENGGTVSS